ncbi:MAG: hypothetical protein RL670_426 [Actinomycetota bacterium]
MKLIAFLKKNLFWVVFTAVVAIGAGIWGYDLLAKGPVTLNTLHVQQQIEAGVKKQTGLDVRVTCPSPFVAKIGESRECQLVDKTDLTIHFFVGVTVKDLAGNIAWHVNK